MHVICSIFPDVDENGCTWSADGELCVAEGVLNVRSAANYRMALRVESGLKARSRDVPPQGEPNGVQITSATVELRTSDGARLGLASTIDNPYDALATGYLPPNGVNFTTIVVIPNEIVDRLKTASDPRTGVLISQIVAAIKLKGVTNGGLKVESSDFLWPIRLSRTSPAKGENECVEYENSCTALIGQDGFANICTQ
ncbi:MAG: hypothetical protein RLZZ450_2790 [Pseudomonadota bacterium]|jgi:hypothetical protein